MQWSQHAERRANTWCGMLYWSDVTGLQVYPDIAAQELWGPEARASCLWPCAALSLYPQPSSMCTKTWKSLGGPGLGYDETPFA